MKPIVEEITKQPSQELDPLDDIVDISKQLDNAEHALAKQFIKDLTDPLTPNDKKRLMLIEYSFAIV